MPEEPHPFHIMAKPTGAKCNLSCSYCFFLPKEKLYPGGRFRMSDKVLESYIRQALETGQGREAVIAWQGGEPALMGLDFFRRSVDYQKKYRKPGVSVQNTIQTNGVLVDDEWCRLFRKNKFLVGLSLDGPKEMHDAYRLDKKGRPTFSKVLHAIRMLQKHGVDFNILATINAANAGHPFEVYRFFRDEVGAQHIQFIPVVERISNKDKGFNKVNPVTGRSVESTQFGRFLISVFDEWVRSDVGNVFVQIFDGALASWLWGRSTLCIFSPTCGQAPVLEHNGDLYSCDHFVEPEFLLGNIIDQPIEELVLSDKQRMFGENKLLALPQCCRECDVLFACFGECPKNRFIETPDGEPGLNYLCSGYKAFFKHIDRPMRTMADLLRRGRPASEVMRVLAAEEAQLRERFARAGRNDPCPCGSGLKLKRCHGALS